MLPNNLVEVRKNHKFNLNSLNNWVDNHLENYGSIINIKQFVGGQSNPRRKFCSRQRAEEVRNRQSV